MRFLKENIEESLWLCKHWPEDKTDRLQLDRKLRHLNLKKELNGEDAIIKGDRENIQKFMTWLGLTDNHFNEIENESLKEDIDPKTNDTDDLYAVWIPYVGKRIVDKETMIKYLQQEIEKIKQSNRRFIGDGLAYRNIQMMCKNPDTDEYEPRVPNHSDEDFLNNLDWKD